ncbi:11-beta-hydroxysteroid dehydrogenase-like 4A [Argentina anserina]|uniref:11-beta-hydroxysteroid dehydrogenase-like 4A n=1 Tax=Argentina anserina TaxID=57926 RepID=UPI00217663A9|nr:11-beta-hydroxysteroid dehydrogenase-like 4A [Potentilla anserina]
MKLNHKVLNIVVPLITLTVLVFFLPPFLIYKFLRFIYRLKTIENVAGKVILITGASSGIGEHLAYEYGKRGARLALAARREDRLRGVADKARRLGSPDAIVILADVSKAEDCNRLVNDTVNHFGQLDHLVNNAGVTKIGLFEDCNEFSHLKSIMDTNFWGSVYCTKFAVPYLRKSKGKIVVMSSSATWFSIPRLSFYNASKAAQTCFFETLRAELGSDLGITIVSPGVVRSEMTETPEFQSQVCSEMIPSQSTQVCATAIVDSACRGDMNLTDPPWIRVAFWLRVFCPQLLESITHSNSIKRPRTTSNKEN